MKILALERDDHGIRDEDFTSDLLGAEATRVWELYQDGVIREMYFRQDVRTAVLVLECDSIEEANDVLHTLPLVNKGLIAFDIILLVPYDGFERLFADGS